MSAATKQTQERRTVLHLCSPCVWPAVSLQPAEASSIHPSLCLLGRNCSRSRSDSPTPSTGSPDFDPHVANSSHLISSSLSFPPLPTVLSLRPPWSTPVIRTPLPFCWSGLDWFQPPPAALAVNTSRCDSDDTTIFKHTRTASCESYVVFLASSCWLRPPPE